jgi:hypothetical protein
MSKIWRTGSLDSRAASIEERTEPSPQFREQAQESGGLAGLSGSGQHDHRARLRGALDCRQGYSTTDVKGGCGTSYF